ncbi:MAG: AMP-binding protein [Proteobacteria bacterium]|nr:AMP-binding protein [Pseudomonadota bacterium]
MFPLSEVFKHVAQTVGHREAIVHRERRFTYADLDRRSNQLANGFTELGLGCFEERASLENWQAGQDRLAIYLHNGPEYLEGMLAAFKARVAPFNVNYRYVEEELIYLLNHAKPKAILFHRSFGPQLAAIRPHVPSLEVFIEVDDVGTSAISDAQDYETFLGSQSSIVPSTYPTADDLYVLYTGGTTGKPKGVLWRQADIFVSVMGGRRLKDGAIIEDLSEISEIAAKSKMRMMPAPPFMHAAGQWNAFIGLLSGNTIIIQDGVDRMQAGDLLDVVEREGVTMMSIVGDAFAQPLIEKIKENKHDLSSLRFISNSGAHLSTAAKHELCELIPGLRILDFLGSTEGGNQGQHLDQSETDQQGEFRMSASNAVLNDNRSEELTSPGDEIGWWARRIYVPLGYLDDKEATLQTFPTLNGVRYSIPGDRARLVGENIVQLLGRDSLVINSGGEKIFVEEVEEALKRHPAVCDALVLGRPSLRWGTEVVSVVALHSPNSATFDEIISTAASHIARYKLPKEVLFVDDIRRHANGKPDYEWAADLFLHSQEEGTT